MSSRVSIRCIFSQAHLPSANGKAEVSGKVFCDVLRRVTNEKEREDQSFVELIPMAVSLHDGMADPEAGFSPYRLVFGRDRPGFRIHGFIGLECAEANGWCERAVALEGG